jgi:molybdate transport system substrate-binding protein
MNRLILAIVLALGVLAPDQRLSAQPRGTLTIAAASDLQTALPEVTKEFERATGIKVTLTFGSSGNFFAQIQNGAPFDVFLSADADYPRRLAGTGHVDSATVYDYATGSLVLWTRNDRHLDLERGLAILRDAQVRRIAIASPAAAPYGRAAVSALTSAGLLDAVKNKLAYAENVAQAAQLAQSGNADVALIGHALALGPTLRATGHFVEVPASLHPPVVQAAGVVTASRNKANARAFVDYLKTAAAAATLRS